MNKISLDLSKVKDFLDARFQPNELSKDLLEIGNKFGFPKSIYVSGSGEIWSSDPLTGVETAKTPKEVANTIRSLTAKKPQNSFKVSDMVKMVAPPDVSLPSPALDEASVLNSGSEITKDMLGEPELAGLCEPDQDQVAVMVFDVILASKNEELEHYPIYVAKKMASYLNSVFQNLHFQNIGEYIEVIPSTDIVDRRASKEEIVEVLKVAFSDVDLLSVYESAVSEYANKVSSTEPDYFLLRDTILAEVKEQLDGQK